VGARRIDDALVLIHLRNDGIYEMNTTAARVWELLSEGCEVAQMRARLPEEFDMSPEVLDREVCEALAARRQAELVMDGVSPRREASPLHPDGCRHTQRGLILRPI